MKPAPPISRQRLEFHEIEPLFPYSWPWLLIDRVLEWEPRKRIVAQKCVSAADPLVAAHFANGPRIYPGALLIELLSQTAFLLGRLSSETDQKPTENTRHALVEVRARFLAPAYAGDVLTVSVELEQIVRGVSFHKGTISCANSELCRATIAGAPVEFQKTLEDVDSNQ